MVHVRTVNGTAEIFGNQGALFMNAMTWWDHTTGSVWSQVWGRAIEGPLDAGDPAGDGLPEASQNRLQDALREITATSRQQLEAIKFSQLLHPPTSAGDLDTI